MLAFVSWDESNNHCVELSYSEFLISKYFLYKEIY